MGRGHRRRGRGMPGGSGGWLVDRGRAGPVASVVVAVRTRPLEHAGLDHLVAPGGVGLEPVVEPAERGEVVALRRTGLWSPLGLGVGVVRDDVVDVAAAGRVGCTTGTRRSGRGGSTCSRIRSGTSYAGVERSALRSITGLTVTFVRESAHQSLTWSSSTRRWPSSIRPVGPNTVARSSRDASKWAWRTTSRAAGRPSASRAPAAPWAWRSSAVWVRARSPRAADRRASSDASEPSAFRRRGAVGEGAVEVEGVGDVELGLEPHRAGEVDVVVVDRRVARVDVEVAVLRIRGRVGRRRGRSA